MTPSSSSPFALPDRLAAKADPDLIGSDERFFAMLGDLLDDRVRDLTERLDRVRRAPAGRGQAALDRDLEVHRLTARLRLLRRFGLDLCLGRMVREDGGVVHVGRLGLSGEDGEPLLVDWRAPAAEPFFGATHADPMGLASRRRYRWSAGRVTDYWDEVFTLGGLEGRAALDDQSAFIASLGGARDGRMPDVLATINADQDAVIRAGARGALVVDGGPGTGKTVVALHRAAYLLHADPRLADGRGGVLVVGPHRPYLEYVGDVLPSLGEDGVLTCTLRDLVPEGASADVEADPEVARLKASTVLVDAVEPAVRFYEEPPTEALAVDTPWGEVRLEPADWAEAFDAVEVGTPHNDARDDVWEAVLGILVDRLADQGGEDGDAAGAAGAGGSDDAGGGADDGPHDEFDAYGLGVRDPRAPLRGVLTAHRGLARAVARAWPILEASEVVGDLWSVPAYLRRCAPSLSPDEVRALQREVPDAWTVSDLPLLDAARHRLGDPEASSRRRTQEAAEAAQRRRMADVVDHLVATDDSELGVMSMLRGQDLRSALVDVGALPSAPADRLAGPFSHIVVDEAQELTDAEWRMLLRRCPSRSLTVVGDRAQARHGFTESWEDRLARVGAGRVRRASLRVNYRTPEEVMLVAEPVIRAVVPDANVPVSVRRTGVPVARVARSAVAGLLDDWLGTNAEGVACVIGDRSVPDGPRVRSLPPQLVKGLEFDLVVLVGDVEPAPGIEPAVDRYVAMTRATQRLVLATEG